MAEGERLVEATLSFFDLALQSGSQRWQDGPAVPAEPDDFLQTLRDELLPAGVDVNPALEVCPDFVRDLPSPEACFVLELVKQPPGKPKSMHFTTPVTDAEARLLTSQPVWRISWCDDPRVPQILSDPQFQALSGGTLTDLLSISLVPELDLRPFTKLLSVLGHVGTADVAPVLRRMPRGLESLCLTAEGAPEPRDFEAGASSTAPATGMLACCLPCRGRTRLGSPSQPLELPSGDAPLPLFPPHPLFFLVVPRPQAWCATCAASRSCPCTATAATTWPACAAASPCCGCSTPPAPRGRP
jgi:hypothetical protein